MKKIAIFLCLLPFTMVFGQANNLNAFGDTPWGTSFQDVRGKFESLARNPNSKENIQILNEVKNKILIVKRNNVNYIYRFYKEPKEVRELAALNPEENKQDHKSASGLFSVGVVFSPVESIKVRDSMKKYGSPSREYLVENTFGIIKEEKTVLVTKSAEKDPNEPEELEEENLEEAAKIAMAYIWNLSSSSDGKIDGGYVIQWNEPYQKKLYTKRIDFFSSELSSIINSDYKKYFSARETKIIYDLLTTPPSLQEEGSNNKREESSPAKDSTPEPSPGTTNP